LQGLTAHYLTKDSYSIKKGDVSLVHAAAGGVGQLLIQIIKLLGGTAIGLTSSEEKRQVALSAGAESVFLYSDNWKESVMQMSSGKGVDVVYESVGSTIMDSFDVTRVGGTVVFFGMAGGDPVKVNPRMLMDTSKTLTGGDLWNVLTSHEERVTRSGELFNWIAEGKVTISKTVFPLSEGGKAHEFIESRKSTGKIVLIP
jgi:NADPH:quinone reductase